MKGQNKECGEESVGDVQDVEAAAAVADLVRVRGAERHGRPGGRADGALDGARVERGGGVAAGAERRRHGLPGEQGDAAQVRRHVALMV